MTDPRSRRGVPDRLLLPPPPREPELAERWRRGSFEERRRWARLDGRDVTALETRDREMVAGLARARLATSWRLLAGAPLLGWLVFMTVWGFGRSTYPQDAQSWLLAGALLGGLGWLLGALAAAGRLRRARRTLASAGGED